MEINDFQNLTFKERAKADENVGLRRWVTVLFLYPALELMFAGGVGLAMGKLSDAGASLYFVPSIALLVGVAATWTKRVVPTYLSLIPSGLYMLMAISSGRLLSFPVISVVAGSICVVVLGARLSRKRA
jgi:hypothetical protein